MAQLTKRPMTDGLHAVQRSTPRNGRRSTHRLDIPRAADLIQKRTADHILFMVCVQYSSWKEVMIDIDVIVLPTQPTPGLALHDVNASEGVGSVTRKPIANAACLVHNLELTVFLWESDIRLSGFPLFSGNMKAYVLLIVSLRVPVGCTQ